MNFLSTTAKLITKYFVIISLILPYIPAHSANITDVEGLVPDGSTNTITDRAPNNTPIVNIAVPSADGVSLNNWEDYNVSSQNQILNNAKGATVDTNLAGQIYGNPNFNPSSVNEAQTIVNQVTSGKRTNLNGATEIAGKKANLIIANGNGIDVAGASYINTSSLFLVAGSVNMNQTNGAIDSFALSNLANSSIIITGVNTPTYANLGLDASSVDYVNIIARSAQVLGDVHAKNELNFKLGNGTYNYNDKTISSSPCSGVNCAGQAPSYALDSQYLGGMYAGKISLIATENGVGVRTRGDLVSNVEDIVFDVAGDIEYERLNSQTNINLTSSGKISQGNYANPSKPAIVYAKGNVTLNGLNGIELNDSSQANNFYSAGSIYLSSLNGLVKNNSTIKAQGLLFDSSKSQSGGLFITSKSLENNSSLFSSNDLSIITTDFVKNVLKASGNSSGAPTISGTIEALKKIYINSLSFENLSLIKSGTDTSIISSTNFIDTNQIKANGNLSIIANTGIAYNDLYSGGDLSITNNISGNINHNYKSHSIGTTNINNKGGNIVLGLGAILNSNMGANHNEGSLYSKGNLTIASSLDITNNTNIFSENSINLTAQNFVNNMRLMAISGNLGANISDLAINLEKNLTNYGLLYANRNINLNVDGIITNDAYNNNSGEIFALNGNVNINGRSYITNYGNVSKYDFFYLSFDKSQELWEDLELKGYITADGKITDKFKSLESPSNLETTFGEYRDAIYQTLNELSAKVVREGAYHNSLDRIYSDYDALAPDIFAILRDKNYIDSQGNILQKFYENTKDVGALGLDLGSNSQISFLRDDIYQLLQDTKNGKIFENSFLSIAGIDNNLSRNLTSELRAKGYIDDYGNVTQSFEALNSAEALAEKISSSFANYKNEIFNLINQIKKINKVSESNLNSITYKHLNQIDNFQKLFDKLVAEGYILDGKLTDKFTQNNNLIAIDPNNPNDPNYASGLILYKTQIEEIFNNKNLGDSISESDFSSITQYHAINDINTPTQLLNQLKAEGYIDKLGNVTDKFYNDNNITSSTSSLKNYQTEIQNQISKIAKASFSQSSFRNITKSLDNSAERLIFELIQAGYLDEDGRKTANFNFVDVNEFANVFSSVASGGEYESVKSAIFDTLQTKQANYVFSDVDFLGNNFDQNILYDENRILMKNLIDGKYVSNNGDILDAFYNLAGDYSLINVDQRFSSLKTQIGQLLTTISSNPAKVSQTDLKNVAQNSTREKATQIFQNLQNLQYLDEKGNFTDHLMNQIINYSGDDQAKIAQLQNNLSEPLKQYANGIYVKLKEVQALQQQDAINNGITNGAQVTSFTTKLENKNGARISSSLGDIKIKALTLENIGIDMVIGGQAFDPSNPENPANNALIRTPHYGIAYAWKNTVLWGYEELVSNLKSLPSYIQAGNKIDIEADKIYNKSSIITAGNNIDFRTSNLENTKTQFLASTNYIYESHSKHCKKFRGCKEYRSRNYYPITTTISSITPSIISSGNSLKISAINDISIDKPSQDKSLINSPILQKDSNPNKPITNINPTSSKLLITLMMQTTLRVVLIINHVSASILIKTISNGSVILFMSGMLSTNKSSKLLRNNNNGVN
ncbi:MAG: filamentous hemagglutinin N-terminal domain-containing protein [Proteobacteria bacterium]|nr:filamentous hemagglutinin N-terminal domain-containing protein [Pseudomonadota bacterium]